MHVANVKSNEPNTAGKSTHHAEGQDCEKWSVFHLTRGSLEDFELRRTVAMRPSCKGLKGVAGMEDATDVSNMIGTN